MAWSQPRVCDLTSSFKHLELKFPHGAVGVGNNKMYFPAFCDLVLWAGNLLESENTLKVRTMSPN